MTILLSYPPQGFTDLVHLLNVRAPLSGSQWPNSGPSERKLAVTRAKQARTLVHKRPRPTKAPHTLAVGSLLSWIVCRIYIVDPTGPSPVELDHGFLAR